KFFTFPDGSVTVHVNLYVVPTEAPVTLRARMTPGVFDSWVRAGIIVSVSLAAWASGVSSSMISEPAMSRSRSCSLFREARTVHSRKLDNAFVKKTRQDTTAKDSRNWLVLLGVRSGRALRPFIEIVAERAGRCDTK